MAITRAQVANISEIAAWMQENAVPNIFKSVAYADGVLTATDADDNTVLEINGGTGAGNSAFFRAYRASGNYIGYRLNMIPNPGTPTIEIIGCDNGFMFSCGVVSSTGYGRFFSALFTKTNNDKVAVIFSAENQNTAIAALTESLNHVAFGDSATISTTTTFTPESAQQTVLTPFATNADVGDVSYTPNAYYMPMHSNYTSGVGKFYLGMDHYITNGYWAIKDNRSSDS